MARSIEIRNCNTGTRVPAKAEDFDPDHTLIVVHYDNGSTEELWRGDEWSQAKHDEKLDWEH